MGDGIGDVIVAEPVGGTVVQLTYTVDSTAGGTVVIVITSRVVLAASEVGGTRELLGSSVVEGAREVLGVSVVGGTREVLAASVDVVGGIREVVVESIVSVSMGPGEIVSLEVLLSKEYAVVVLVTYCVVVVVMVLLSEQAGGATLFANAEGIIEQAQAAARAKQICLTGERRWYFKNILRVY